MRILFFVTLFITAAFSQPKISIPDTIGKDSITISLHVTDSTFGLVTYCVQAGKPPTWSERAQVTPVRWFAPGDTVLRFLPTPGIGPLAVAVKFLRRDQWMGSDNNFLAIDSAYYTGGTLGVARAGLSFRPRTLAYRYNLIGQILRGK